MTIDAWQQPQPEQLAHPALPPRRNVRVFPVLAEGGAAAHDHVAVPEGRAGVAAHEDEAVRVRHRVRPAVAEAATKRAVELAGVDDFYLAVVEPGDLKGAVAKEEPRRTA